VRRRRSPGVAVKPLNALALYRVRLRARLWQECFAVIGIAAGVALLFSSQVATSSLGSSVGQLSRGIAGDATLQVRARDPHGFQEDFLRRVRALRGVRAAAPVLEADGRALGPRGSRAVELIGADASLSRLGGRLVRDPSLRPFGGIGAVALPAGLAGAIGVSRFGQEVRFQLAGRTVEVPLYTRLHKRQIGQLVAAPVALVPLSTAQEMTGLAGRVSRVLVEPAPGPQAAVQRGLRALAGGRLDVESIDHEQALFATASTASNQSTALFAAISALVGFLFAFNAVLFSVPQRRRLIVDLRREGYTPAAVLAVLLLDALLLGLLAVTLGLALGEELSSHLLRSNPAFLSLAFTLGTQRVVSWQSVALAAGGGMLAATLATLVPLRDIFSSDPLAATGGQESGSMRRVERRAALCGAACVAAATITLLVSPDAAIPAMALLVGALLLVLPLALSAVLAALTRCARSAAFLVPHVAAMELGAAGARAVAISATGAMAIFGSVAIQGAHGDLLAGLENAARDVSSSTDVWIAPGGSYDLMNTAPFAPAGRARLERLPGVRAVRDYRGGLLDLGRRRVLVIAPPGGSGPILPASQIVEGDPGLTARRLRSGGWAVLSKALAGEQRLHLGEAFTLASPDPAVFRVAALSTNLGWAPGAIVMSSADYARAWGSNDISAFSVLLARGARPGAVRDEIQATLGPRSTLVAQTAGARSEQQSELSRQALSRLTQIATLIPIVAALAMAAAIGAMIWQRRPRLAKLKLEGIPRSDLWQTVLLESLVLLGVGCLVGEAFGLYGQQLADRALADTINFPVVHSLSATAALSGLALMAFTTLAILAAPGWLATAVPPGLALQD